MARCSRAALLVSIAGAAVPAPKSHGAAATAAGTRFEWIAPSLQLRTGFDSNPLAVRGPATAPLGTEDSATFSANVTFGFATATRSNRSSAKVTYTSEAVRFADLPDENFHTHRFAATTKAEAAHWTISADASTLLVDGSRDTLLSLSACNGNSTALWRERRAQWQHRAKLSACRDFSNARLRLVSNWLVYDYLTRVRSGQVAFADRSDLLAGSDIGWLASSRAMWFTGARVGRQHQDTVPLPGGAFEYSNSYYRLLAGWEGKLGQYTSVAIAAGPDFRRYHGAIDARLFGSRARTLGWFDASLTTNLTPRLALSAKTTRWAWLSSTGKSAYNDLAAEVSLAWAINSKLTFRSSLKAHQCSYFPTVREDWEYLGSIGATFTASTRTQLTVDVLDHRGWNELSGFTDRRFTRSVVAVGVMLKL